MRNKAGRLDGLLGSIVRPQARKKPRSFTDFLYANCA